MGLGYGFGIVFWDIGSGLGLGCRFGIGFGDRVLGLGLRDIGLGLGFWGIGLGLGFRIWVWGWTSHQNMWPYGPYMDFPPEICGPYGPYMIFLPEFIDIEVHIWPFEGKFGRRFPNFKFWRKFKQIQMTISTSSMRPKTEKPEITENKKFPIWLKPARAQKQLCTQWNTMA